MPSVRSKMNGLMVAISVEKLKIEPSAGALSFYQWNAGLAKHYFCRQCGVYTHHQRRSRPDQFSLNVACLDGVKTETYTPAIVDGANIPLESEMQIRQEVDENKFIACGGIAYRPFIEPAPHREIVLVTRPQFPRQQCLEVIRDSIQQAAKTLLGV